MSGCGNCSGGHVELWCMSGCGNCSGGHGA